MEILQMELITNYDTLNRGVFYSFTYKNIQEMIYSIKTDGGLVSKIEENILLLMEPTINKFGQE